MLSMMKYSDFQVLTSDILTAFNHFGLSISTCSDVQIETPSLSPGLKISWPGFGRCNAKEALIIHFLDQVGLIRSFVSLLYLPKGPVEREYLARLRRLRSLFSEFTGRNPRQTELSHPDGKPFIFIRPLREGAMSVGLQPADFPVARGSDLGPLGTFWGCVLQLTTSYAILITAVIKS